MIIRSLALLCRRVELGTWTLGRFVWEWLWWLWD